MTDSLGIIVGILLLIGNAFFVGAEFAVISARRSQIEPRAEQGSALAKMTLQAMENVSLMLAMAQLGITMCSLGLGAIAEPAIAHLMEEPLHLLGVPDALLHPIAFVMALSLVVFLHVVAGEMIPKNISLAVPDQAALILAPMLVGVAKVFTPVIFSLNWLANITLKMFGVEPKDEVDSAFTAEQVQSIVDESHKEGLLQGGKRLLTGALEFSDQSAGDVMVPLANLVAVPSDVTPSGLEREVSRTGFSRFPVRGKDDDLLGYLHLKDVLYADEIEREEPVQSKRLRAMVTVHADDDVEDALATMQGQGAHLGRVVDQGGATMGVIFLEDILEELVGEIEDEERFVPT